MGDGSLTMREAARLGARALHATYRPLPTLWAFRVRAGLSQNELAKRAGLVAGSHVGRIERGQGKAAPKTVARLAAALGVEEVALRGG